MSSPLTVMTPELISVQSESFLAMCRWPFADSYVTRLLIEDIPQRVAFNSCRVWIYRDAQQLPVGFGTLDLCDDCAQFNNGQTHLYIPLLAVNPARQGQGFGTGIVQHLIEEATVFASQNPRFLDYLFLDVYNENAAAIGLYSKLGFQSITANPLSDPLENDKPYRIMARSIRIASS
jgi:ribosomal protein S18 acetylase RimI-like enzyme